MDTGYIVSFDLRTLVMISTFASPLTDFSHRSYSCAYRRVRTYTIVLYSEIESLPFSYLYETSFIADKLPALE
jgi:hypothetical protein